MSPVRPRFQVDASTELIEHAKVMAHGKQMNLTQYVLTLLAQDGDEKMKQLVAKELGDRVRSAVPPKPTE